MNKLSQHFGVTIIFNADKTECNGSPTAIIRPAKIRPIYNTIRNHLNSPPVSPFLMRVSKLLLNTPHAYNIKMNTELMLIQRYVFIFHVGCPLGVQ